MIFNNRVTVESQKVHLLNLAAFLIVVDLYIKPGLQPKASTGLLCVCVGLV